MLKLPADSLCEFEKCYPGFQMQMEAMESTPSSPCPLCGRVDAARIIVGRTGRTLMLAAASTRCHLLSATTADIQGMTWFCGLCQKAFA